MMKACGALVLALCLCAGNSWAVGVRYPTPSHAGASRAGGNLVIDVWTDRGDGAVYHIGDPIRVHFRASSNAYVILYNVDTEGKLHLLFPTHPEDPHWVQAGVVYTLPGEDASYDLQVDGPAGVEYLQALVSLEPFQQIPDYFDPDYQEEPDPGDPDWRPADRIEGDPFVGMERINRSLLPYDCDEQDCFSAAYTRFYVDRKEPYPRYLCADCHGPYAAANYDPYGTECPVFEVRVDYDWHWRTHDPFYFTPYWYYFRRADCAPRYYGYKQRWSSSDGWIRFKDTFGVQVRWKRNPGYDPKGGGDASQHGGGGGAPGMPGGPGGAGGSAGGGNGGFHSGGQSGAPPRHAPGFSRGTFRTDPTRVPAEQPPYPSRPVRFRSKSRDLAPPGNGRFGPHEPVRKAPQPAPAPTPPTQEPSKHVQGHHDDAGGANRGEGHAKPHERPKDAPGESKREPARN